jgi:hypothetical protein
MQTESTPGRHPGHPVLDLTLTDALGLWPIQMYVHAVKHPRTFGPHLVTATGRGLLSDEAAWWLSVNPNERNPREPISAKSFAGQCFKAGLDGSRV